MSFNYSIIFGNRVKKNFRRLASWGYYLSGVYKTCNRGKILILMYHRVLKDCDETISYIQPGMYVVESVFEKQMDLLNMHYQVISLKELLVLWKEGGIDNDKRYCIVTFDDGWLDNYLNAYPILMKYNIPATIFLATSLIGTNNWFWPEKLTYLMLNSNKNILDILCRLGNSKKVVGDVLSSAIKEKGNHERRELIDVIIEKLKSFSEEEIDGALNRIYKLLDLSVPGKRMLLDWDEITEMSKNGISFGSHTCTHKILTTLTLQEVNTELAESKRVLKERKVNFVPVFCYPNGSYNQEIQKSVKDFGYEAAVTTKYGLEEALPNDYYGIKRIGVHNDISSTISLFSFHLSGLRQLFTG